MIRNVFYLILHSYLTDLQEVVIIQVWQGRKYWEIAEHYGCTEGHAKDTGSLLWQLLSEAWDVKVTKSNFKRLVVQQLAVTNLAQSSGISVTSSASDGSQVDPVNQLDFIGREAAIAYLEQLMIQGHKIIVLQGEGGVGKTTLAQQFLASFDFDLRLEVLMAKETCNIISAASVVEEWLQRDLKEDSGKEFGVTLARLKRQLEQRPLGILIDNLEPALDQDGRLIAPHRDYLELLRILAAPQVKSTTLITSRDRICEGELPLEHYRLPGLDLDAWHTYFAAHQINRDSTTAQLHRTYGGNPKAMGILGGIIQADYAGDLKQYWQENRHDPLIETDLKNLVGSQFDRLQLLDPQAYRLLCRLGCYRYQDVSRIPLEGLLCLLWDIPSHPRRVIKSLRHRSLLEFAQGQYWLHPVVRAEANLRLKTSGKEWSQTQQCIANYLTESIKRIDTIQDGLIAFEAFYHYLAIFDYQAAAKVILYSRENQWGQFLTLGTTLCRLGIIEPLTQAIKQIIDQVEHQRQQSELNNILGDLYWTVGKIHRAIACQQRTLATSQSCYQLISPTPENRHDLYYWRMLEVDSLLSMGLYHIDLAEWDLASTFFEEVINLAHNIKHHGWAEKACLGAALVNSQLEPQLPPHATVSQLYRLIVDLEDPVYNTGRFAYFMELLGRIYFNLGKLEPAQIIWQRAISFSQTSNYHQIKAKALVGLGNIKQAAGKFHCGQDYYLQAINLLEKIAAKCDLAEAYVQLSISYFGCNQLEQSHGCLSKAIHIYQNIPAPKQLARIQELNSQSFE